MGVVDDGRRMGTTSMTAMERLGEVLNEVETFIREYSWHWDGSSV